VIGHVSVGVEPDAAAVGEGAVWVTNLGDRTVSRVDPKQRTLESTISLNATPSGIAVGAGAVWWLTACSERCLASNRRSTR
jgi:streptogramin lyase